MKILKGLKDSVKFTWLGLFGGSIAGGNYYLLWTVHVWSDIELSNLNIESKAEPVFFVHN